MGLYKNIIKADYLQRTRSYSFLIILLAGSCITYSFIPAHDATYSTVRVGYYIGKNNAAWIGNVTAIMANIFLWFVGFYLINNGIMRDKETGVGQIIATTSISNFNYLTAKALSNFCILLTITAIIILMSFGIYVLRSEVGNFSFLPFFLPYLFATVPSMFLVSVVAVFFEVLFSNKTNLLNIVFLVSFGILLGLTNAIKNHNLLYLDPLGVQFITHNMIEMVNANYPDSPKDISVGYIVGQQKLFKYFDFTGTVWTLMYVLSRLIWIAIGFCLLFFTSKFFNRFDSKVIIKEDKKLKTVVVNDNSKTTLEIQLANIPIAASNFSIFPLIKTEITILIRKGTLWFWVINIGIMILFLFIPIRAAHQIGLPILWLLQINRWADIASKEKHYNTHFFMFSAYKPLERLLTAQLISGFVLALFLALPIIIKYLILGSFYEPIAIVFGAMLLIAFAVFCGIVSGGKRTFEFLFLVITYAILNGLSFLDYLGTHNYSIHYLFFLIAISICLLIITYSVRKFEIKHQ